MRASRLLSMLILLQVRGRMSATALAREFEVSVRTVYRDADQLSAAGVPIYAERGRGGGFKLLESFGTRLATLTSRESEALALSSVTQAAADLGLIEGATAARHKLLASLPSSAGAAHAARIAARFHLDPLPWYGRRALPTALRDVAAAVWSDRRLRITYESWNDIVCRTVAPLGLVMKAGTWYLVALANRVARTYRIDAIRALDVLDAAAQRPANFDLARYWTESAQAFEARLVGGSVRARFSATGLRLLRDFFPRAWETVQPQVSAAEAVAEAGGWVEATIPFEQGPHAVREALRLGAEMQVLKPAALRAAVAAEATRIAALNRSGAAAASKRRDRRETAVRSGGRGKSIRD